MVPGPSGLIPSHPIRCKKRTCPSCGVLWAGDTRRKILANVEAYDGDVILGTITAPGSDVLPNRRAMVDWNLSAPSSWRRLNQAARQATVRAGFRCTLVERSWEYQKRGALHVHFVLGAKTAGERAGAHRYMLELERLRAGYSFGFVSDTRRSGKWRRLGPEIIKAERAARYVAKYLSPLGEDGKPTLSETVTRGDVPPNVVYVARALTLQTGITMRFLRWCRIAHVRGFDPVTGQVHDQVDDVAAIAPVQLLAHAGPTDL